MQDPITQTRLDAVLNRNASFDDQFVYGVTSTKVFCRPSCPSRRPRPERVRLFDTPEAALEAGFRPCRRCNPQGRRSVDAWLERVRLLLESTEFALTLHDLSREVNVSPAHLQRRFKAHFGTSPRAYQAACLAERFRSELRREGSVSRAVYAAGYGSSQAAYRATIGMTPGRYRRGGAGERVRYTVAAHALGSVLLAATERGVCAVRLGEAAALEAELHREYPQAQLERDDAALRPQLNAVLELLEGRAQEARFELDLHGTAFQAQVWEALRRIPYGQTRSYSQLAEAIGAPSAVRAVARACGANPVAVVVPCHRIIGKGGQLGGYRWGVAVKRHLLDLEAGESHD
ncbi:AraC family transcriptional regulator of adaptative response/methylated-DNA-[protein]-cysteine methyltransferase [Deinobacterium chartae]|uniref:methylated-DNA--[protein]-cysteine S-methyltransferase n=1 Tax=Deinobacterium chartae TaxID=521158 RepID=A0A841HVR7_9DEIO|nr:bifunctional DNA-binding transcriptional regulator/O6-methylguanine-DNA methyltransferase Ada [Deinobacterium chartae]MBB6097487.1 AraC family transcriptional regulator of adaptative response/methylated-DNA-[protein]-cysteine methyltransferase [Deinobacterium chartae]